MAAESVGYLHKLCRSGNLKKIQEFFSLIPHKETVEEKLATGLGENCYTPLHEAVLKGDAVLLGYLVQWAKDVNYRAKDGSTPFDLVFKTKDRECMRVLLIHQADCTSMYKSFRELCIDGDLRKVQELVSLIPLQGTLHEILSTAESFLHVLVVRGHADVLDYLLQQAATGIVNRRDRNGSTPLHLAAHSGNEECTRVLLRHNADLQITDRSGKTPKKVAVKRSRRVWKILLSEEIVKEVEMNGDNLTDLLRIKVENLEDDCLNRALKAAIRNDNHSNVSDLIVKGADNIEECIKIAKEGQFPHARAMLLLVRAAIEGNRPLVLKLFGEFSPGLKDSHKYQDEGFQDVQKAVRSGEVSTVVPIEIARRHGHNTVREELLLKTYVIKEEGTVYWHGLRLLVLDVSWLRRIHWVKKLRLARNGFKQLPNEMGTYLKQVVKLDLQHNDLSNIPKCILELPSLQELNLSHNKLVEIPDVTEWSAGLTVLDLSYNHLHSMPFSAVASSIRLLNISHNQFQSVPICICAFTTLHTLNISENPKIRALPAEMGRLHNLTRLDLGGLKNLNYPPKSVQRDTRDCICYLYSKLRNAKGFYHMNLMIMGCDNRGKTTLMARLQGIDLKRDESTVVDVSDWTYRSRLGKRPFHFSIWDFRGQEEYYATHQCFLSQRSLYLLLFNLKDGESGVEELKPWLNNIALRAPRSCIIVVGTHLDEVADDEREEVDVLLRKAGDLAGKYSRKVEIVEVVAVGLKNRIENIGLLKEAIYSAAANYKTKGGQPIMGQMFPGSYHELNMQLKEVQKEVRSGVREPIMHAEEFKTMVQQMNLADIYDEDEIKAATLFLTDVGTLLHYDDRGHNLHELYFVDLCWLCYMMYEVVRNPYVRKGLLYSKDIPLIFFFKDNKFPWQYLEQYFALFDRFEIALPLDNTCILIPSMLPDSRPAKVDVDTWEGALLYSRYIIFSSADTPPGFWSRLLSRIMHSVPQVTYALCKTTPEGLNDTSSPESLSDISWWNTRDIFIASITTVWTPYVLPIPHSPQDAPLELPNFPKALPSTIVEDFDVSLEYWCTGLFYSGPDLMFRVESISRAKRHLEAGNKDGVVIVASPTHVGKKLIGHLVDLVVSLVSEWYPGLQEGTGANSGLEQRVPCYECLKLDRPKPFEIKIDHCLPLIARNQTTIECGYEREPARNHTVSLADIVPDLLLEDIDPEFLLNAEDILYDEDESSLLGKGGYGKVFRGKCHNKPVAIKKYLTCNEEAFSELRSEAKFIQKSHHPCLVCLVGVCIHPMMALVLEEAPMGSLEKPLMKRKLPIHRVVIHRIAVQVAAALRFLHSIGIIFRDLKAANVLLWSLDHKSLCHCKIADFSVATHLAPSGAKGLIGTKGFIAPEVLYIGKRKQYSVYDHKADIFSFGMLLYEMISRRHPYHDLQAWRIDAAVESGDRPKLQDVPQASAAFHYLTHVMQTCWEDNPRNRPSTEEIIKNLCLASLQSVMCVHPVRSRLSLRHAVSITPADFTLAGIYRESSEVWVVCDGAEGAEINVYANNTMVKISENFIKENQVQCIGLCGDHIWVGSRAGIEYGVIDIFSINSHELVHNIRMHENSISCITCSEKAVYLGTLEGYCIAFSRDIKKIQGNAKPRYKYVSEHAVDGIMVTQQCLWVSHTRFIFFLNLDNLCLEGSVNRQQMKEAFVGQLSLSPDGSTVWSAHLGGTVLSAWNAQKKENKFDVDVRKHLQNIAPSISDQDAVITSMTPALDTVWVGMASGHILVFHNEELLVWYHAYTEYVRFLSCTPSSGPCEKEQCMVLSGAKGFKPPFNRKIGNFDDYDKTDEKGELVDKAGVLVLWEAFDAKMTRQVKLVEENAPDFFEDHDSVRAMIYSGDFKDGTHLLQRRAPRESVASTSAVAQSTNHIQEYTGFSEISSLNATESLPSWPRLYDSMREHTFLFTRTSTNEETSELPTMPEEVTMVKPRARTATFIQELFDIKLPDGGTTVRVSCPKPVKLNVLLSELQTNIGLSEENCKIEYCPESNSDDSVKVQTQEDLEKYLKLENRPHLFVPKQIEASKSREIIGLGVDSSGRLSQELESSLFSQDCIDNDTADLTSSQNVTESTQSMYDSTHRHTSVKQKTHVPPTTEEFEVAGANPKVQFTIHTTVNQNYEERLPAPKETTVKVSCPQPVKLQVLLRELQTNTGLPEEQCKIEYRSESGSGECVKVETQEDLEKYLKLENRPQVYLSQPDSVIRDETTGPGSDYSNCRSDQEQHDTESSLFGWDYYMNEEYDNEEESGVPEPKSTHSSEMEHSDLVEQPTPTHSSEMEHSDLVEQPKPTHSSEMEHSDLVEQPTPCAATALDVEEPHVRVTFDVRVQDTVIKVSCPKPVQFEALMNEIELNTGLEQGQFIVYDLWNESGVVKIESQEQLDEYLQCDGTQLELFVDVVATHV